MRRLHRPSLKRLYDPYIRWVWRAVLLTTIGLGLLGRCFFGWLLESKSCVPSQDVLNSLLTIGPWALLFLLIFGGLTRLARRDYLRGKFDLLVPAKEFRPENLRFQVLNPGERAGVHRRPFYLGYISRTAVENDKDDAYDEEALAEKVLKGEGFVLFGEPLSGKSRTLYEVVRRIGERTKDYEVLVPPKKEVPDDEAFSILKKRRVILLLEDLNDYMGQGTPLRDYVKKLENHGVLSWAVVSTCGDGPAMTTIRASEGTALGNFYRDDIPLKLNLRWLTAEEKGELARSTGLEVGQNWDPEKSEQYPTPGFITMKAPINAMDQRFKHSLQEEHKDALRALKLLGLAGVQPFTHRRLQAVLEDGHLFGRQPIHLRYCLELARIG